MTPTPAASPREPRRLGRTIAAMALGLILALFGYLTALGQAMSSSTSTLAGFAAFAMVGSGLTLALFGFMALWRPALRLAAGRAMLAVTAIVLALFAIGTAFA